MSHRRVKALDYDDVDYDEDDYDYEEEEEVMSTEDKESMRLATIQVKEVLGPNTIVTETQIQESLWHTYFDVDKTVTYLTNLNKPTTPKNSKQNSRSDQTIKPTQTKSLPIQGLLPASTMQPIFSAANFFYDTPWGAVSRDRLANLHALKSFPRGGLLGGSTKPSKLAALAAARKKKEEERQANAQASQSDRSIALLDRLGTNKENARTTSAPIYFLPPTESPQLARLPSRPLRQASPPPSVTTEESPPENETQATSNLRAQPSVFAQTMFGQRRPSCSDGGVLLDDSLYLSSVSSHIGTMFSLPYASDPDFASSDPFAGPSPDDVALRAQSKGSAQPPAKAKAGDSKVKAASDTNGVTKDVARLSVKDYSNPKHKNLNVLEEFKKSNMKAAASFVVVGHVDHGKSTLMGRLLYDLQLVSEISMERLRRDSKKIGKSSFALAWVMDATSDERERGITVDIATNHFSTDKTRFTILDAPGHQDFIPNMIAGASQADFAVLVIDSSNNAFESGLRGQTKEHALLVRSMGIQRLIVAVNKMDMCDWSQERFEQIRQQMTRFLEIAGFTKSFVSFVPCAGLNGDNIVTPISTPQSSWYKGLTLVQELDNAEPTKRALEKPLRMTISEVFRTSLNNPVSVSGKLDAGSLQVGDVIKVQPSGETAIVKSLEADGEPANWCVAGQIAVLNLSDIDPIHLKTGDIVCDIKNPIANIKQFTAKILTMEHVMPMFVEVHRGPLHIPGRITTLVATLDKASGEVVRKKPKVVQPGSVARVVIELEDSMPLEAPAKVILRADGRTVAAGLME